MSENLVICPVGMQSSHRLWNIGEKNFDTVLLCNDKTAYNNFIDDEGIVLYKEGSKFPMIKEYLEVNGLEYEYYLFINDDTGIAAGQINKCFEIMSGTGIKALHPAVCDLNRPDTMLYPNDECEYRFANWAGTQCIFMSKDYLAQVIGIFDANLPVCRLPELFYNRTGIPFCIYDIMPVFHLREPNPCLGQLHGCPDGEYGEYNKSIENTKYEKKVLSFKLRNIISFCIIFDREKLHYLPDCINSLPEDSEIVLVETTHSDSQEGLDEIQNLGNKIFAKYNYKDWDWSKARNACKSLAKRPVIFSIDSDERIAVFQHTAIIKAALDLHKSDFAGLKVRNISIAPVHSLPGNYNSTVTEQVRIFKNIPQLQWRAKCHENIEMSMYDIGMAYADSNILIHHVGYDTRPEVLMEKHRNRLRMLINDNDYRNLEGYFEYIVRESVNYNYYKQLTKEAL